MFLCPLSFRRTQQYGNQYIMGVRHWQKSCFRRTQQYGNPADTNFSNSLTLGFQKNLVVWKCKCKTGGLASPFAVSEELSSMEIYLWEDYIFSPQARFRRTQQYGNVKKVTELTEYDILFQKNLVVWKSYDATHLIQYRVGFQKNLVVWKFWQVG